MKLFGQIQKLFGQIQKLRIHFQKPIHGWSRAALGLLEVACRVTDTSDVEPAALQFFFSVDSLQIRRIFFALCSLAIASHF